MQLKRWDRPSESCGRFLFGLIHFTDRGFELQLVPPDIPSKALQKGTHQMTKKKSDPKQPMDKDNAEQSASAPTNPLEEAYHAITKALEDSGLTVRDLEPQTGINRYQAHFIQRRKEKNI